MNGMLTVLYFDAQRAGSHNWRHLRHTDPGNVRLRAGKRTRK
jgi:hypothetical protein